MDYELGAIVFDEYLDFYDKKMVDRFDKPKPKEEEKEERPIPPPKKATLPPQLDKPEETPAPEEEEQSLRPIPKPPQLERNE